LSQFGLNPQRLELAWISAGEAERFAETINSFVERIIELGPSPYAKAASEERAAGTVKELKEAADV